MTSKKLVHTLDKGIAVVIDEDGKIHVSASAHNLTVLCGKAIKEQGALKKKKKKDYCDDCAIIALPKHKVVKDKEFTPLVVEV